MTITVPETTDHTAYASMKHEPEIPGNSHCSDRRIPDCIYAGYALSIAIELRQTVLLQRLSPSLRKSHGRAGDALFCSVAIFSVLACV